MAFAVAALAAAWTAVAATVTAVAAAVATAAATASLMTWVAVAASAVSLGMALFMRPPSLGSQGQQVSIQMAGPHAAVPLVFGRTGTQGIITWRGTYGSLNDTLLVEHVLSVGPVDAIESFSVMGRALTYSGNPSTGMATVTQVAGVDMRKSKLFRYDGLRVATRVGSHSDTSTLSSITGDSVPGINSTHAMSGLARTILRCRLDEKRLNFPNGYPDDPISVVRGVKCYDPRLDSTQTQIGGSGSHRADNAATHEWSENPYIVALNYALGWFSPNGQKMFGLGVDIDMIDVPSFTAAANVADANGWKVGGQVTSSDSDWAVITNILASGGGVPIDRGGKLSCFVRAPKVAAFTLRTEDVVSSRKVTTSTPMASRVNRIVPSCRQANQKYEMISGEIVSDPAWIEQDNGNIRTEEIEFPLVSDFTQAHQLAAYYALETREFLELEVQAKPRALACEVGDCIELDLPEFADGQTFIVMSRKWDASSKTVSMTLKSETFAKHAFALGQSQTAPTPPSLVTFDPNTPAGPGSTDWAVTNNSITQTVEGMAATVIPALVVAGENRDPNVQKIIVETRHPITADDVWPEGVPGDLTEDEIAFEISEFGWTHAAEGSRTATEFVIAPLAPMTSFDVSVRYERVSGALSDRLIIPAVSTAQDVAGGVAPGGIEWDPTSPTSPIANVPNALVTDANGMLNANTVAHSGFSLASIIDGFSSDFTGINADVAQVESDLANAILESNSVLIGALDGAQELIAQATTFRDQAQANATAAQTQAGYASANAASALTGATNALANATLAATRAGYSLSNATLAATRAGYALSNATASQTSAIAAAANAALADTARANTISQRDAAITAATNAINNAVASAASAGYAASNATSAQTSAGYAGSNATLSQTQAGYASANASLASSNAALSATYSGQALANASAANTSRGYAVTNATAAQTSAGYATANAATAQTQSGLSATYAGQAQANATAAQTSAGVASTQAGYATANAATASTQSGLSATYAGYALTNATTSQTQAGYSTANAALAQTSATLSATNAGYAGANATAAQTAAGVASTQSGYATTNAATAQTQAGLSATYAGQSQSNATLANTARVNAQANATIAQTQSGYATANAATALTQSNLSATYAGQAQANATAADVQRGYAASNASLTATQLSYATANASLAQSNATLSATFSGYASANSALANTARTAAQANAAISQTQAGYATANAATASTQSGLATTYAGQAQSNATLASTQLGYATSNASLAQSNAVLAATYSGQAGANALSAAAQAVVATTQAGYSTANASLASTSATLSATYRDQTGVAASATFPETISGDWLTRELQGNPSTRSSAPNGIGSITDGVWTSEVDFSTPAMYKAVVPWSVGKIYEIQVEVEAIAGSGGTVLGYAYAVALKGDYAYSTGTTGFGTSQTLTVGTRTTITHRFGMGVTPDGGTLLTDTAGDNAFIRFGGLFNYGTATGRQTKLYRLSVRDVTALAAAETQAGVSTTQAGYATANAAFASTNATLSATFAGYASANATAADTARGYSASNATIASTQAGYSNANAAIATIQAGLSTTFAGYASANATAADVSRAQSASNATIASTQAGYSTANAATATTQAGLSTTFAGYSAANATLANTRAGYAASNATIATTQAGYSTANAALASTSATLSATYAGQAVTTAESLLPERIGAAGQYFHKSVNTPVVAADVVNRSGFGPVRTMVAGGAVHITAGMFPATPGKIYEVSVDVELAVLGSGSPVVRPMLYGFDSNSAYLNIATSPSPTSLTVVGNVVTISNRYGLTAPSAGTAWPTSSVWLRGGVIAQSDATSTVYVRSVRIRDVTALVAAEAHATISASNATISSTQAGYSTANAAVATTQAGLSTTFAGYAATNATAAQTQAGYALSNASISSTQAGYSDANAAVATTQAGLSTTFAGYAASNATAAQTQAGYALSNATIATTQAGYSTSNAAFAATNATLSATRAGYAATNATLAQTQAGYAGANAALASTSATLSATYRDQTGLAASATFPETIAADWLTRSLSGDPDTVASAPGSVTETITNGVWTSAVGANSYAFYKAVVPWSVGKIYEVQVEVEAIAGTGGTVLGYTYFGALKSDYIYSTGTTGGGASVALTVGNRTTITRRFGMDVTPVGGTKITNTAGDNAFIRFGGLFNHGTATDRQTKLYRLSVRDVTALVAAETQAGVSTTQAGYAGANAALASASAILTATYRDAARLTAASLLPDNFGQEGATWFNGYVGDPATRTPITSNSIFTFPTVTGVGKVLQAATTASNTDVSSIGVIPNADGRRYRFTVRIRATSAGSPQVTLFGYGLTDTYGQAAVPTATATLTQNTWVTLTVEQPGSYFSGLGAAYLRPFVRLGTSGHTYQIASLKVEDVTESHAAQSNAAIATSQAGYSSANAAFAATNATLSATRAGYSQANATAAQTAAGYSAANATIASTQSGYATSNASIATTQAGLSTTFAGYAASNAALADADRIASAANATIATTQAGYSSANAAVATTQAGLSTTFAGYAQANAAAALTQAGYANSNAAISTTQAGYSSANASLASSSAGLSATWAGYSQANATAAQTSAGYSAANATIASTQSGYATSNASIATTQAGLSTTFAGYAAANATLADADRVEAASSAAISTTQAGYSSANAATATTQAGLSTTFAGYASANAALANTRAGYAQSNATIAATQAGYSSANAAAASTSATLSASYRDAAIVASRNFGFEHGLTGWTGYTSGAISAAVDGRPNVFAVPASVATNIFSTIKVPVDVATRKYRVRGRYWTGAGTGSSQVYIGFAAFDAAGNALTHNPGSYAYVAALGVMQAAGAGWVNYVSDVIVPQSSGVFGFPTGTAFIAGMALLNYNTSNIPTALDEIVIEDVTESEIARANAVIATTQAAYAIANVGAAASRLTTVEANTVSTSANVTTLTSTVAGLSASNAIASWSVAAAASGGLPTRIALSSSSYGSNIALVASQIYFGDNTVFDDAVDVLVTTTGSVSRILAFGAAFGTDGTLTEWEGPSSVTWGNHSRANAHYYRSSVAPYAGGSAFVTTAPSAAMRSSIGSDDLLTTNGTTWVTWATCSFTDLPTSGTFKLFVDAFANAGMTLSGLGSTFFGNWRVVQNSTVIASGFLTATAGGGDTSIMLAVSASPITPVQTGATTLTLQVQRASGSNDIAGDGVNVERFYADWTVSG